MGSTTPQGRAALAFSHVALLPSDLPDIVGFPEFGDFGAHNFGIPSLHVPLPNASSAPFVFAVPSHGSRSGWFATPFLYDSFIHYSTPVYPDAIQANRLRHQGKCSICNGGAGGFACVPRFFHSFSRSWLGSRC